MNQTWSLALKKEHVEIVQEQAVEENLWDLKEKSNRKNEGTT